MFLEPVHIGVVLGPLLETAHPQEIPAAQRPLLDGLDELPDPPEVYVGLQESHANLSQGVLDIFFRQLAVSPEVLECTIELFRQIFKHKILTRGTNTPY